MTSTQRDIEVSYDVSNEFFRLWLDEGMHYTSASFLTGDETLEQAQVQKCRILADYAEVTADSLVLDIGCGWGSNLEYLVSHRGVKRAHGITLSTAQAEWIAERKLPGVEVKVVDYAEYEPAEAYDALVSIEMIDHLCSPEQSRQGLAVELYRQYFNRVAQWVAPGACFGFQAILRNRVPRNRKDLEDLAFTADVIFPGGLNPRLEELVAAANPRWEVLEVRTQRESYGRTTAEWLRRMRSHEATIRKTWGDQLFDDYDRYLSTCVRAFDQHYSSDVQMKLRRID
ncbi:MAG TPA: class I SAM-dependent methyltransferase [Polyangiaceae bacterium LLY-WYZ-14_1]|jgi:cyclopropane-fatty-acyl-phospholipid synthase|nr:class I SAM-dependent methyltransferase [Polyangiaceae bacterium LLY-WYZ-14_1]